jgi:hypothetical protein
MNIELKPEQEQVITQAIQEGMIHDPEEALNISVEILRNRLSKSGKPQRQTRTLREVFDVVRGMADDVDFSRNPSTGRPVDLA